MTADPDKEQEARLESVINLVSCPICGNDAMNEVVHHAHEENIQCHSCGYGRRTTITNGKLHIVEHPGLGCYKVQMKDAHSLECGSFASVEAEQVFIDTIKSLGDKVEHAEYSKFIDGVIETVTVVQGIINNIQINEQKQ